MLEETSTTEWKTMEQILLLRITMQYVGHQTMDI